MPSSDAFPASGQQPVRSICFSGGTDFAIAIYQLFGDNDVVGDWSSPALQYVHPDDAHIIKDLLSEAKIPFGTMPNYTHEAYYRA